MLEECHKNQDLGYTGTIIDIETKGDYCRQYKCNTRDRSIPRDSREYQEHELIIFGYINRQGFHIYCAKGNESMQELKEKTRQLLTTLDKERPLCAFNCHQEMSVFFHQLNLKILFDKELQSQEFESKDDALRGSGIFNSFGDPFHNKPKGGYLCSEAWKDGDFDNAIKHNRACLLKEQALLLKGRGITPIPLDFKEKDNSYIKPDLSLAGQPWTREQEDYVVKAWKEGKTIKSISQDGKRRPRAIWMRLQILGEIPRDIPYIIENESWTIKDLP